MTTADQLDHQGDDFVGRHRRIVIFGALFAPRHFRMNLIFPRRICIIDRIEPIQLCGCRRLAALGGQRHFRKSDSVAHFLLLGTNTLAFDLDALFFC